MTTQLDGGYTIMSGERDGKPIPEERIKGTTVRFTGNKVVTMDKDSKEVYVATFTTEAGTTPTKIHLTSTIPGEYHADGLIEKTGDTIKLAYNLPGGPPPTSFQTTTGQHLFVMKNLNK